MPSLNKGKPDANPFKIGPLSPHLIDDPLDHVPVERRSDEPSNKQQHVKSWIDMKTKQWDAPAYIGDCISNISRNATRQTATG
ncbi:hypothetical protein [Neorhizobium alkalisoli]|uniref:hypothetical protein n=1 Tax=Neorhizobium alkalisoli TaxID=528178 RepID=UPI0011A96138|nr:hypothetical protein [Neorhizobium alkalisoli]